jgi:prepilin-type N-terminal cleavage/methylation domain-containing protein
MNKGFNQGFTLIEVLAALGLFGIVLAGLMSVFWFGFYGYENEINQSELQYTARQARYRIMEDFLQSSAFAIKDIAGNEVPAGNEGVRLHLVMQSEEVEFYVNNNQLYRDSLLPATPAQPVASNIKGVTFNSPAAGLLEFNIIALIAGHELKTGTSCMSRVD